MENQVIWGATDTGEIMVLLYLIIIFIKKDIYIVTCNKLRSTFWVRTDSEISRRGNYSVTVFSYRKSFLISGGISRIWTILIFLLKKNWYFAWKIMILLQNMYRNCYLYIRTGIVTVFFYSKEKKILLKNFFPFLFS